MTHLWFSSIIFEPRSSEVPATLTKRRFSPRSCENIWWGSAERLVVRSRSVSVHGNVEPHGLDHFKLSACRLQSMRKETHIGPMANILGRSANIVPAPSHNRKHRRRCSDYGQRPMTSPRGSPDMLLKAIAAAAVVSAGAAALKEPRERRKLTSLQKRNPRSSGGSGGGGTTGGREILRSTRTIEA